MVSRPVRTAGSRAKQVIDQAQRGLEDAAYLRELVLAHPDLAERLTLPPIDCVSAAHWNGFIPPLMTCAEGGKRNDSPRRPALIEVCAEAMARELGQQAADTWKWTTG
jgi:hypothetical protein